MNTVSGLTVNNLSTISEIKHAFFKREGGVSKGLYKALNTGLGSKDISEHIMENRDRAMAFMGMPGHALCTMYQVHGANVIKVLNKNEFLSKNHPQADALVTNQKEVVLGILTADCVPVLFADPLAGIIGAAHAGWRGTISGVLSETVKAMEEMGAKRKNIYAGVGPAIAQPSYEVGPNFAAPFIKRDKYNKKFFRPSKRAGHQMFDLTGCLINLLKNLDIASINHLNIDTNIEENGFFSYRRAQKRGEPDYGRGLSAIYISN